MWTFSCVSAESFLKLLQIPALSRSLDFFYYNSTDAQIQQKQMHAPAHMHTVFFSMKYGRDDPSAQLYWLRNTVTVNSALHHQRQTHFHSQDTLQKYKDASGCFSLLFLFLFLSLMTRSLAPLHYFEVTVFSREATSFCQKTPLQPHKIEMVFLLCSDLIQEKRSGAIKIKSFNNRKQHESRLFIFPWIS